MGALSQFLFLRTCAVSYYGPRLKEVSAPTQGLDQTKYSGYLAPTMVSAPWGHLQCFSHVYICLSTTPPFPDRCAVILASARQVNLTAL
jgi:hypothetical protein